MSEPLSNPRKSVTRYIVVEVHDSGPRIMVWHGRGEKDAIRQCDRLNRGLSQGSSIHYTVEEHRTEYSG